MYGTGEETANVETTHAMEASTYEVPVSTTQEDRNTNHESDLTGSTYSAPNVYEYATFGPNEEMVIYFVYVQTW